MKMHGKRSKKILNFNFHAISGNIQVISKVMLQNQWWLSMLQYALHFK